MLSQIVSRENLNRVPLSLTPLSTPRSTSYFTTVEMLLLLYLNTTLVCTTLRVKPDQLVALSSPCYQRTTNKLLKILVINLKTWLMDLLLALKKIQGMEIPTFVKGHL